MAEQDASVAIQNTLQRLDDQEPNLLPDVEFKSVKSKLRRLGSHLNKFKSSVSELTKAREIAYNVEDAIDDAIIAASVANAAHKRWRKLRNVVMFFSHPANEINQHVEKQMNAIDNLTASIASDEEAIEEEEEEGDMPEIPPENDLFFLSLSGFPAGAEISARRLIQIWVAEGFQDPQGRPVTEEQGREQINRLLGRGFIAQVEKGTCGNLKTFTIDQDKLQVCRSTAEKQKFLHVKTIDRGENERSVQLELPRLAIHNLSTMNDLRRFADLSKVRSLQIHCASSTVMNKTPLDCGILEPWKTKLGSLRVLDLGCLQLETVSEGIGKLKHLIYLRLKAPAATRIPASICNLPSLQTIDLKETKGVKAMPVEIWKMKKNLRHLHLGFATALPPPRMANHYDALENLQTLCGVRPDKELKRLMVRAKFPNVNRLRLQCKSKKDPPELLSFLNSLDHLDHLRSLTLGGAIKDLPSDWNAFPPSLTKMTLSKTLIPAGNCVKTLENLPNLRYLKLMEDSVAGTEMKCASGGFPALAVLKMEGLKDLSCWKMGKGAMRLLMDLEVRNCQKLEMVEAFQPSKELRQTLLQFISKHPRVAIQVDPPAA